MTETTALATTHLDGLAAVVEMVTNAVTSEHTKRAYSRALVDFVTWHSGAGRQGLDKATVNAYVQYLRSEVYRQAASISGWWQSASWHERPQTMA